MRSTLETGIRHFNTKERLENLKKYTTIYTNTDTVFEQLTALTATLMEVPLALINYITNFTGDIGSADYIEKDNGYSSVILKKGSEQMLLNIQDPCLLANPLIASEYGLRFYAAVPITNYGINIGVICILDDTPREFHPENQEVLKCISLLVETEIKKRSR